MSPKKIKEYLDFVTLQPKGFIIPDLSENKEKKEKEQTLDALKKRYRSCKKCPLAALGKTQVVFGHGNANSPLMLIGEGPGRDEDLQGKPFVGRSGKLLTKIIAAMGFDRQDVYISNAVKCRPPNNRTPTIQERETCKKLLLFKEIEIIKPKIICTLGSPAAKALLGDDLAISKIRGQFCTFKNILVMPTYHPAYLLRNPVEKRTVWEDMKKIMAKLKELSV